jgi:hypothetical protein
MIPAVTVRHDGGRTEVGQAAAVALLGVVIVALLAMAGAGIAVHHQDSASKTAVGPGPVSPTTTALPATTSTTLATPAGFERLLDEPDHLSLAVPPGWQAPNVTSDTLASNLTALKAKDPSLAPILDAALAALTQIQIGVFAVDTTTRTTLYAYGIPLAGVASADEIPTSDVVRQVQGVGGKNVQISQIHLPVGPAGQVSAQITVNGTVISEALDYFVLGGRLVSIVVATRGTKSPVSVLRQVEPTLAPA